MPSLKLSYPFKPFVVTQNWGTLNPAYAAQFNNPAFKKHNGIDAYIGKVDWQGKPYSEYPVYCPADGFVVESVSYDEDGGGHQISLMSKNKVRMFDQDCRARIWLCHAEKILVPVGYEPKLGELIMIADNTGFSTGIHTHMGLYRLNDQGGKLDTNEATGSFDPALFWTGKYAIDLATFSTLVTSILRYMKYGSGL